MSYSEEHHGMHGSKATVRAGTDWHGQVVYGRELNAGAGLESVGAVVGSAEYQAASAWFVFQACCGVMCPGCQS